MAYAGTYEDCMGLASFAGPDSSRAYWIKDSNNEDVYDHDDTFDFKFLSNGKQYTETQNIEGGTINIVITFNGSNLDMFCEYNTNTFYETETYIGVFSDDPIKWVINNTDLASPLKACEGYLKFSTGNMSFNPYKSGEDILIQTVSGKSYTVRGNAIALSSEIDDVVNTLRIINDERIALYKNKKVDEWNEKSN